MTYQTKHFGEIDLAKPGEWYETEVELNGATVGLMMTCSGASTNIDEEMLRRVDDYIADFGTNEANIRLAIRKDFRQEGETKDYIDDQIEEQEKEDIAALIEGVAAKMSKKEKLLSVLKLLQVVFYPESEDKMFAVFDYTIDEELTDDLLAVKLYKDDSISIDIES